MLMESKIRSRSVWFRIGKLFVYPSIHLLVFIYIRSGKHPEQRCSDLCRVCWICPEVSFWLDMPRIPPPHGCLRNMTGSKDFLNWLLSCGFQQLYFESLLISSSLRKTPATIRTKIIFSCLKPKSCFFGHKPQFASIGACRNINWPVRREPHLLACLIGVNITADTTAICLLVFHSNSSPNY